MEDEENYFHTFYFQAFSDEFALVSDEVDQLVEEGTRLSRCKANTEDELSTKVQDVKQRFLRLQELVERKDGKTKESNSFESFESTARDYKQKFDAVNNIILSQLQGERITQELRQDSKVKSFNYSLYLIGNKGERVYFLLRRWVSYIPILCAKGLRITDYPCGVRMCVRRSGRVYQHEGEC